MISKITFNKLLVLAIFTFISITKSNAQTSLPYSTNFESSNGNWIDGGNDSSYGSYNESPQGNKSWELRDNSGTASSFYQNFNLKDYDIVTISFTFQSKWFNNSNEIFFVTLDNNRVLTYTYKQDWQNNGTVYSVTLTLNANDYTFTNNNTIGFETGGAANNNDKLYIDKIFINGEKSTATSQSLFFEDFEDESRRDTTGTDLYGTDWLTNTSNTSPTRFEVRDGNYFEANEIKGVAKWITNPITITGLTNLKLSAYLAFNNNLDDGSGRGNLDFIKFLYKLDGNAPVEIATYNGTNTTGDYAWNLTNITGNTIELIIQFQSDNNNEIHRIDNINLTGDKPETVIWRNQQWLNNKQPSLNASAIIDDNYNTQTNGSFSCKSLSINTNKTLTIDNKTFVEVRNDVTVNGNIIVETQGAFVQINDNATFTGTGTVNKTTPTKNAWYYYTYWGSPVSDMTINEAFPMVPVSRRFSFNANNYLDLNNDNFDDNGDDWQTASGSSIMSPGVGYACTSSTSYVFPQSDIVTFTGTFNNGIKTTPIVYKGNAASIDHPNLIGNPYASAVDFSAFYNQNSSVIEPIAYYWSQATPANGNGKFSNNDYATYSVGMQAGVAGASGKTPDQYLPSGQAIFVTAKKTGSATFNNSMRVKGANNNSLFFKSANTKSKTTAIASNKLWLNLTSDNGVFSQILIGYVEGATNENDGLMYDAQKLESGEASLLYSTIENSSKRFVIQGKDVNSLNADETIALGFKTKITDPTLYSISIAKMEGDFLNNTTIFLEDSVLNKSYNLTESGYTFTSEVGDFNTRFKIVFTNKTLSSNELAFEKSSLKIIELENNRVKFKTTNNLNINSVDIYDIQGRLIYNFIGNNSEEVLTISNLKNSAYIAKVTFSDGTVMTKKAFKK